MTALAHSFGRRDSRAATLAWDVFLIVIGSLVVAALAQLSLRLPFTPVPISGQTLGVLLVAGTLGATRGGGALLLYLLEGAAGLPVFAEGKSGLLYLTSADPVHTTGGYLWGFVIAAVVIGFLAERGWDRNLGSAIGAMVIGEIIIFGFGVVWLSQAIAVPIIAEGAAYNDALEFGLYPFVIGDILKVLIAAGVLPAAWKLLGGFGGRNPDA